MYVISPQPPSFPGILKSKDPGPGEMVVRSQSFSANSISRSPRIDSSVFVEMEPENAMGAARRGIQVDGSAFNRENLGSKEEEYKNACHGFALRDEGAAAFQAVRGAVGVGDVIVTIRELRAFAGCVGEITGHGDLLGRDDGFLGKVSRWRSAALWRWEGPR